MPDLVYPLKLETGAETDYTPTELDPHEDALSVRAVFLQNDTSDDQAVSVNRTENKMILTDGVVTGGILLEEILSLSQHPLFRQLIHFIDDGPAEGFSSLAYREISPTGPFPTSIIWWESSAKTKKIVERNISWSGSSVVTDVWKVYGTDGITVLTTISDAISYSGPFEVSRTRTITESE